MQLNTEMKQYYLIESAAHYFGLYYSPLYSYYPTFYLISYKEEWQFDTMHHIHFRFKAFMA